VPPIPEQIASIEAEYESRIAAALRETEERRDAILVDVPFEICGVPIRVLTFDDYLTLSVQGNAHVCSLPVPEDEVTAANFWTTHDLMLIWYLSPQFSPSANARAAFFKQAVLFDPVERAQGVGEYMRAVFADAPRGPTVKPGEAPPPDPVGVSFAIHWIATLAARFPWSRAEIRSLPLPELFQYLRLISAERRAAAGKAPIVFDAEVSRLWEEKLKRINALGAASTS
jgi:hypothetical protein